LLNFATPRRFGVKKTFAMPISFQGAKTQNFGNFSQQHTHKWQRHYQMQTVIKTLKP